MRYFKTAAAMTIAAAALTAFAASASATELVSPDTGNKPTIIASTQGSHTVIHNPIAKIECLSTFTFPVEEFEKGGPAEGKVTEFLFVCTNSWHVTVAATGRLSVEADPGDQGEPMSDGATIEATRFGITCRYKTETTPIGTATGSTKTGGTAKIHLEASLPFHSGSGLCGSTEAAWTGSYVISHPDELNIVET